MTAKTTPARATLPVGTRVRMRYGGLPAVVVGVRRRKYARRYVLQRPDGGPTLNVRLDDFHAEGATA